MDHLNKEEILTHHLHTNKINWTNKAIQNLKYNGQVTDRLRLNYKFNYEKGSYLKGLSIRWTPKLNKKIFQLVYWFRDRTFRLDLGEFSPTFGTHECTQVILELSKKYKDNKGNWIKNPVEEIKKSKETTEQLGIDTNAMPTPEQKEFMEKYQFVQKVTVTESGKTNYKYILTPKKKKD